MSVLIFLLLLLRSPLLVPIFLRLLGVLLLLLVRLLCRFFLTFVFWLGQLRPLFRLDIVNAIIHVARTNGEDSLSVCFDQALRFKIGLACRFIDDVRQLVLPVWRGQNVVPFVIDDERKSERRFSKAL